MAARGNRASGGVSLSTRSFLSYRIFVSAMLSLLFVAALTVILTSHVSTPSKESRLFPHRTDTQVRHAVFALKSDPLKTRLDMIHKQANDHMTLVNAYAAYARKLKIDISKQLASFDSLVQNLTELTTNSTYTSTLLEAEVPTDEEVLKLFEKEVKERVKIARSLVAETKENYDNQIKIQKLKDTVFAVNELLQKAKKNGAFASSIAAKSIPKSLHCLTMRLAEEKIAHPEKYKDQEPNPAFEDPNLFHYTIFSDNIIAVSVVMTSVVRNAEEPWKHVFHIVTDRMNVVAMRVWFAMRPVEGGSCLEIKAVEDFNFLNPSYFSVLRQESTSMQKFHIENQQHILAKDSSSLKFWNPKYMSMLSHLRFYLPEMYPKLRKILFLDDDVVVQKDLTGLWKIELDGRVNGAVEMCFGPFHRYIQYLNFSHPLIRDNFNPKACVWAYGMNIFDLDAWRNQKCTERYLYWHNMNKKHSLWQSGTLVPGLVTFYSTTKTLDKSWHMLGLGSNPSISIDAISNAAVIHYTGNMKPWLDIALNQYKSFWTKYVDTDMEFIQMCNFGL